MFVLLISFVSVINTFLAIFHRSFSAVFVRYVQYLQPTGIIMVKHWLFIIIMMMIIIFSLHFQFGFSDSCHTYYVSKCQKTRFSPTRPAHFTLFVILVKQNNDCEMYIHQQFINSVVFPFLNSLML